MEIKGSAEESARTGIPTYEVKEQDRSVSWTINVQNLVQMQWWDNLPATERRSRIVQWGASEHEPDANAMPLHVGPPDDPSWLEMHAIVARNALRNFLGRVAVPSRVYHRYKAGTVGGWQGWIEVNGRAEAFIAENGDVVELSRVDFSDGVPTGYSTTLAP